MNLVLQDALKGLPFRDQSVDAVTAFEFIEHVPRERASDVLGEARRVLKSGEKLVLTTPNRLGLRNRLWGHRLNPKHYHEVSLEDGKNPLEASSFSTSRATGICPDSRSRHRALRKRNPVPGSVLVPHRLGGAATSTERDTVPHR